LSHKSAFDNGAENSNQEQGETGALNLPYQNKNQSKVQEPNIGDFVGSYQLLSLLGRGAMGKVYRANHKSLKGDYAVKILTSNQMSEEAWKRFKVEALAIARMSHPNIVTIYDLALHNGYLPYYAMELLQGTNMATIVDNNGPMPWLEALPLFIDLAKALGYAHTKGIIHRDIKPDNLVVLENPALAGAKVKIVDFGIAKLSGLSEHQQVLTNVGDVFGSPLYMSPEQARGDKLDARSDVYALGCSLFEMLSSRPPIVGKTAIDTMIMHQSEPPLTLKEASQGRLFPRELQLAMDKFLAKNPEDRYQSMENAAAALSAILKGKPLPGLKDDSLNPSFTYDTNTCSTTNQYQSSTQEPAPLNLADSQKPEAITNNLSEVGEQNHQQQNRRSTILRWTPVILGLTLTAITLIIVFNKKQPAFKVNRNPPIQKAETLENPADSSAKEWDEIFKTPSTKETALATNSTPTPHRQPHHEKKDLVDFHFPQDVSLGRIQDEKQKKYFNASGTLTFAKDAKLTLEPAPVLTENPSLLSHFLEKDIYRLNFDGKSTTDKLLDACSRIKGVESLKIRHCKAMTAASVHALNKYTTLVSFDASDSSLSGNLLAQANCWNNLERFYFKSNREPQPILEKLASIKKLKKLILDKTIITNQEFETISRLSNLEELDLDHVFVSKANLKLLTRLKKLKKLSLKVSGVREDALPLLQSFDSLTELEILTQNWSPEAVAKLKVGFPKVKRSELEE
jgi:serine/threonine protein kinase